MYNLMYSHRFYGQITVNELYHIFWLSTLSLAPYHLLEIDKLMHLYLLFSEILLTKFLQK